MAERHATSRCDETAVGAVRAQHAI